MLKRFFLILVLMLVPCVSWAFRTTIPATHSGSSGPGGGAPSATIGWNGDNGLGSDYYSDDSQANENNATIAGTYGRTGNGMQLDGVDHDLTKTSYTISTTYGTICMYINVRNNTATRLVHSPIFEWGIDANDNIGLRVDDDQDTIYVIWKAQDGGVSEAFNSTQTFTEDEWTLVAFSWDMVNEQYSLAVGSTDWSTGDEDTSLTLGDFNSTPNAMSLGENQGGPSGISGDEEVWLDDYYYFAGTYKATCP